MLTRKPKMAILVNVEVPYSTGRMVAQAAHAVCLNLLHQGDWNGVTFSLEADRDLEFWLKHSFTKVVFKVWGEDELFRIVNEAKMKGLFAEVMQEDDGRYTAAAIGPSSEDSLVELTKDLILM